MAADGLAHFVAKSSVAMLTLKHRETHGCIVSTVATDALVLKPQCWLNIPCMGTISYKNITLMLDNIRK